MHPTQNSFQSIFFVPGKTLIFVGVVLVLMGIPVLWGYLVPKSKVLGTLAVLLTFFGLTTPLAAFPLQLFLRAIASHPTAQASMNAIARMDILSGLYLLIGNLILIIGVLLLGIVVLRAHVLPFGIGVLFILASIVKIPDIAVPSLTLVADLFYVITLFAGFGWIGYWLIRQVRGQE
jgi:hypothetical protein